MAIVATVDPVADGFAELKRHAAGLLHDPAEASIAVNYTRGDDRICRAACKAFGTGAATVVGGAVVPLVARRGDDRAEDEVAASAGQEQVGILAVPTEPRSMGNGPVDDRIIVGKCNGLVPGCTDQFGSGAKSFAERGVVVDPCVAADSSLRTIFGAGLFWVGVSDVRAGGDDDRVGVGDGLARVSRSVGVPVCESHVGMEASGFAFVQCGAGLREDLGGTNANVGDSPLCDVGGDRLNRRQWLRHAHHVSVRRQASARLKPGSDPAQTRLRPGRQLGRRRHGTR